MKKWITPRNCLIIFFIILIVYTVYEILYPYYSEHQLFVKVATILFSVGSILFLLIKTK